MGMVFLPVEEVSRTWEFLQHPPLVSDPVLRAQLQALGTYFQRTWLSGTFFEPELWNHFANSGPRTTNLAEGYNNKLRVHFKITKPSFETFMNWLQGEHAIIQIRTSQLLEGAVPKPRKKVYVEVDASIEASKVDFVRRLRWVRSLGGHQGAYEREVRRYLKRMASLMGAN